MNTIFPQISESKNQNRALRDVRPEFQRHSGTIGISLEKSQTHSVLIEAASVLEIRVLEGAVWITMASDPNDYALEIGDTMTFAGPGLLVIEGLFESNRVESGYRNFGNAAFAPRVIRMPGGGDWD